MTDVIRIIVVVLVAVVGFLLIGVAAAAVNNWLYDVRNKKREARGFEVKLNTGETPVPREERDDDHG